MFAPKSRGRSFERGAASSLKRSRRPRVRGLSTSCCCQRAHSQGAGQWGSRCAVGPDCGPPPCPAAECVPGSGQSQAIRNGDAALASVSLLSPSYLMPAGFSFGTGSIRVGAARACGRAVIDAYVSLGSASEIARHFIRRGRARRVGFGLDFLSGSGLDKSALRTRGSGWAERVSWAGGGCCDRWHPRPQPGRPGRQCCDIASSASTAMTTAAMMTPTTHPTASPSTSGCSAGELRTWWTA